VRQHSDICANHARRRYLHRCVLASGPRTHRCHRSLGNFLERPVDSPTEVVLPDLIAVRELAAVLRVKPSQIIAVFTHYDIQKAANDNLDFAAASWVCHCFGVKPLKEQ
jgi:hypothetical protein